MEYMTFDYNNINKDVNFTNYYNFALNNKLYKFYIYDLFLSQYDNDLNKDYVEKSKSLANQQKFLLVLPYISIFSFITLYYFKGFFISKNFDKEKRLIIKLFLLTTTFRFFQKAYLKYECDSHLTTIYKSKELKII